MNLELILIIGIFIYFMIGIFAQISYSQMSKTILMPIIRYPKSRILRFLWILSLPSLMFAVIFLNILIIICGTMLLPFVLIVLLIQIILNSKLFGRLTDYINTKINKIVPKMNKLKINKIIKWLTEEV